MRLSLPQEKALHWFFIFIKNKIIFSLYLRSFWV